MATAPCVRSCEGCDYWINGCFAGYEDYNTCPVEHEFDEDVIE